MGFALVNTRGGSDNGEDWHRQAMGANKRRAFEDLDAAVEHLVARGDAARGKAVALGISNGGLVVTATSLLWPEHYAAVIAQVPVTDLVRSHLIGQGFLWTEDSRQELRELRLPHGTCARTRAAPSADAGDDGARR